MEERFTIKRAEAEISVQELLERYYSRESFEELCRKCENYGRLWSCPPYDFSPKQYLEQYERLTVIGTQILLDEELREEKITREGIAEVTEEVIQAVKEQRDRELLLMEKEAPGRRMLSSGGCRLCSRCAREQGMPCRQRGRMRYSLESLGCDVARLTEDKLGLPLLWASDRLPEYFVLVNGMLFLPGV